ncbi:uncharacterized protein LOC132284781 [Cornus florida]|uniref:uncharacterized protein LOC132284781 n=1 Tax=Cornus florida TaxID=4283 RepID=UPI00289F13FA|nr:uncharacterized protein LOC132284781 [Cornus florida]
MLESSLYRIPSLFEVDSMIGNKRRFDLCTSKASTSSDKEESSDSGASSSNHVAGKASARHFGGKRHEGRKVLVSAAEVKLIDERLRNLEEEAEVMKKSFFESMEERKKLMNEIDQQFQAIHRSLHSKIQFTVERSSDGILIINPHKIKNGGTRTGLSQILHEESNPSLVIRDLRATFS